MAKRTDVGGGRGTATPNLDPSHELPANTGTSTLGTGTQGTTGASTGASGLTGAGSDLGGGTGSLGNTGSLGSTGSSTYTGSDLGSTPSGLDASGSTGQQDQGVTQQAKEQAKNLANEAKDQTVRVAEQARDHVQQLVGQQKDQAADRLGSLAGALREAGRKLNEGEQSGDFGRYADRAAEQVERLSNYLRDNDLRGFVRDTEDFARRRPEVFLGGALLAGLALARFLKASSPNRNYDGYERGGNWTGYPQSAAGHTASYAGTGYTGTGTGAGRSSYTPERRNPDEATTGTTGTYNAPLGV